MGQLNLPEKLSTERLVLQRLRYEDAEELFYTYASKPEATKFVSWPTHQSLDDTRSFLRYAIHAWSTGKDYSFSIRLKESNRLIGSFGIMNDDGKVQFGYTLSPTQWGRGYATEVCKCMMQILKKLEGVIRIQTFVDVENVASANVLLKSGLVEEAHLVSYFKFVNQDNAAKDCILFKLP
ncbi:MAG TPA: GNAT family N-acetyltransferase [Chryseolinea sp.]|nr:GNAT family N-acetyltransferase [Chryseolinea sp.]HPM30552.1 GNAT family N-acetyltransferase [Chryseolinea sp.]